MGADLSCSMFPSISLHLFYRIGCLQLPMTSQLPYFRLMVMAPVLISAIMTISSMNNIIISPNLHSTIMQQPTLTLDRVQQAKNHYTHPSMLLGSPSITGHELLDEYLISVLHTYILGLIFYFAISSISYYIFFKRYGPQFTPLRSTLREYEQQVWFDIKWSIYNILGQAPLIALIKMAYPYYSKVQYDWNVSYLLPLYLLFHVVYDQFLTYWVHRLLHTPTLYGALHNIHHKSKSITPYSGFAFHPLDAFGQAVPVFTSCYFVPLPIDLVIAHGLITSIWAISIHDNMNMIPFKGILYAGSHSIHHFPWGENYNYGKITSVCDRLYGSYCDPSGITGYGYKPSPYLQSLFDRMNAIYERLVPDNGKAIVQKQSRHLYQIKLKKMLGDKTL